jgi:acyl carrier protein
MKSKQEILSAVQQAIATVLDRKTSEITAQTNIVDDLGAESIDFLDISSEIEKELNFELNFKDIASGNTKNLTVDNIVTYLHSKIGQQ